MIRVSHDRVATFYYIGIPFGWRLRGQWGLSGWFLSALWEETGGLLFPPFTAAEGRKKEANNPTLVEKGLQRWNLL